MHLLLRSTLPQTPLRNYAILKLRDSEEDLSQVQNVIRQCSMQNRSTEQTLLRDCIQHPTAMAVLLIIQFSTFALSMERHFLIQQSQFLNILKLHLQRLLHVDIAIIFKEEPITGAGNFHALVPRRFHGPVYFQNGFCANFEYLLNSTNQSIKPTDLKMIFFAF